jgi:Protein of unknown function (DUF3307)
VTGQLAVVFGAFVFLHFKHFLCDFPFQTDYQVRSKRVYGHPGGIFHAALHGLATVPVFFLLRPSLALAIAIVAVEFVLHYHIDWAKENILAKWNWRLGDRGYWSTFGFDQMLHNWTYVGIIAATM